MNENLKDLSKINNHRYYLTIENIQIIKRKNQILLMLEDIEQMNVEVKQNDIQPENILYYQLNQQHQNIMYLVYIKLYY
jgi:hypothetical protein